jgi:predicted DNA-binding protein (MmcQ/YjbR family)
MNIERFRDFCLTLSGSYLDFPFDETTMTVKVGPRGRGRMFALADVNGDPPAANLKCEPELARDLRAAYPRSIMGGRHMNKEHWNTVLIDGELEDDLIERMVVHSYERVVAGLPRRDRP